MSSQARNPRGDERRLDLRTLVIASIASAVAAIVVSRIWTAGTPIAAAATPVFVTLLRELLDRPTGKIAERLTSDSPAVADTTLKDRPRARERSKATEVRPPEQTKPGDIRIYRQQSAAAGKAAAKISPRVILITALLAFVIAGVVITAGQIAIGNPFGSDGRGAIFLGQHKKKSSQSGQQKTVTETAPTQTAPQSTTTTPSRDKQQTTTTPQQTTPQQTSPQAAPKPPTQTTTTPAP